MRAGLLPPRHNNFDNAGSESNGVYDENIIQFSDRGIDARGLYQQQQSIAAGENHRGGASGIVDDGSLPGWIESALPVALKTQRLPPQLPGE
jgi:hypothetical protein